MCGEDSFPSIAGFVRVLSNREIAASVCELVVDRHAYFSASTGGTVPVPAAGQFFMLRARPSGVLLGRPISVYLSDEKSITFLLLKKGKGTVELCNLREGDSLDLVGPIGNRFLLPDEIVEAGLLPLNDGARRKETAENDGIVFAGRRIRIAVIGGGIGVAPVAGFSLGLPAQSFDFYASFRSDPYGMDMVSARAKKTVITTEDGSAGVKGMLPAVFDASAYDLVYACGPTPMLRYVKTACAPADPSVQIAPLVFLSLEEHMACGAGACLGCTVRTISGNRRCCVDGPVFNAAEVLL